MRVVPLLARSGLSLFAAASVALLAVPLHACANGEAPDGSRKMTKAAMKANGSGVLVAYRVDPAAVAGQAASVVIEFEQITDPSGATVRITGSGGVVTNADAGLTPLPAGAKTTLTVSVTPPADGVGYLNVFTTQAGATSVTSIPVGKAPSAMPLSKDLKQTPGGESIITMPVK